MGLYLLRHCITHNNTYNNSEIDFDDLELSSNAVVFCSPMIRCRQTAVLLCEKIKMTAEIYYSEFLVERCFGIFEGKKKNVVQNEYPGFFIDDEFDFLQTPPEGESYYELLRRIAYFWTKFNIGSSAKYQDVVIVSHSNVLKVISRIYFNERAFSKQKIAYFFNGKLYNMTLRKEGVTN